MSGPHIHAARPDALHIRRQAENAVRVGAARIGFRHDAAHHMGVWFRHADGDQHTSDEILQAGGRHADRGSARRRRRRFLGTSKSGRGGPAVSISELRSPKLRDGAPMGPMLFSYRSITN